jgi:proteasome assembly chaperone (PAC2) family protein
MAEYLKSFGDPKSRGHKVSVVGGMRGVMVEQKEAEAEEVETVVEKLEIHVEDEEDEEEDEEEEEDPPQ